MSKHSKGSEGFTLIEIGIIVPILILTVLVLFDALFALIRASTIERSQIDASYDKQIAVSTIENDVILTSLFLPTAETALPDPYTPTTNGGKWSYLGDSSSRRVLILKAYSTTTNTLDSSRQPVFIGNPLGAECNTTNIYFNDVKQHNIIYFVKNGNLFRRRIVDTATASCSPQYQKLSCPSASDLGTAQNSSCVSDDELIAKDVTDFTVNYYSSKTSTTPLDVYGVGADPDLVTTALDAEVTITLTRAASGTSLSNSSTLRMSKLNAKLKTN